MRAKFLGKDPESQVGNSPTLFATDRTDRKTFIAQGWRSLTRRRSRTSARSPIAKRSSRSPRMCSSSTCRQPGAGGEQLSQLIQPGPKFRPLFQASSTRPSAWRCATATTLPSRTSRCGVPRRRAGRPALVAKLAVHAPGCDRPGTRFARVRVVSLPLTDYSRFGVWCAQYTNGAGEDIRYLTRDQAH